MWMLGGTGLIAALLLVASYADAPAPSPPAPHSVVPAPALSTAGGEIWALSFVRARPGQRERLERYLKANWLALDDIARSQGLIQNYRMLRAEPDARENWDFMVILEYADKQTMNEFVPAWLALGQQHPHKRIDGLDFADLGEVVLQKTVTPVAYDAAHE